ncbi:winged helix-turn-helix domain-containing protein [Vibrio ostreicida]|nr:winged helix-turn-helix domain-containing protein [Vibrio ostreicida]
MKEFGKHYRPDSIYYLLNHMGFFLDNFTLYTPFSRPTNPRRL